jgi:5-methylcytosine-specific restriction endonuclease McrA
MSVSRAKGDKAKCDNLIRKIVHARGYCQNCGSPKNPNAAHIIGRSSARTRTDEDNFFLLCASCHTRFHANPDEWMAFVDATIGRHEYTRLKQKAESGKGQRFDWAVERARLQQVWDALEAAA